MLGIERRRRIMERLNAEKKVYVPDLAQEFNVTEETIRRDLERLEHEDLLRRSYGGAVLNERTAGALSFARRSFINSEDKNTIAAKAAKLIENGATIMLDASTTSLALLPQLKGKKDITIITNSARALIEGADLPCTMLSSGGTLRPHSLALTGPSACSMLSDHYADFAFLSCKGLDREQGVMESSEEENAVKQMMLHQSHQLILLADHSKFNQKAFVKTCSFDAIHALVTDNEPDMIWERFCAKEKIRLIY